MKKFDLIVIGWGKGGKTLAGEAAVRGESVAIIERDPGMYGGTCVNVGCIPSKSLVVSAERGRWSRLERFEEKAQYYRDAIQKKRLLTAALRRKMFHKLADQPHVEIFNGIGSFSSAREVEICGKNGTEKISGRRIVIDTGSAPVIPPIEGILDNPRVFTSREMLDMEDLPRRLLIVGGGYIGMEFASIYSGFGSKVTVIQDGDEFLPREDRDIAAEIAKVLSGRGVDIATGFRIDSIQNRDAAALLTGTGEDGAAREYSGDAVLIAAGRRPNTAELHPERAGIGLSARGGIVVDEYLRTGVPDIWAVGDVADGLQFTYISLDDARIVARQLFEGRAEYSTGQRKNIPYSVFLDPPYSRVGINEREARSGGLAVKIAKLPASAVPKAQVLGETAGLLKAVIDPATGRILGAMLFCAESHELINQVKLAMEAGIPYSSLRDGVYTHPTMSEAFNDLFNI